MEKAIATVDRGEAKRHGQVVGISHPVTNAANSHRSPARLLRGISFLAGEQPLDVFRTFLFVNVEAPSQQRLTDL